MGCVNETLNPSDTIQAPGVGGTTNIATSAADLFVPWNVDENCAQMTGCVVTNGQRIANCQLPVATAKVVKDYSNDQFSVGHNITSLGDGGGSTMDVSYAVSGGAIIVDCSLSTPLEQTYCYPNSADEEWRYSSSSGLPLAMIFSAGTIESSTWDKLWIHDGTSATGDLLFEHTNTSQFNLADLMVVAPSGNIYMRMTSDGSSSCADDSQTSWAWVVGCLDCTPPTATFSVVLDCENSQFFVQAVVTSLGSDNQMELTSSAGAPTVPVTGPGTYQSGPYPLGTTTIVTLVNDANNLCSLSSPGLTNSVCPIIVDCSVPTPLQQTYCYPNSADEEWRYSSSSGLPLAMIFSAGTIESSNYDHLWIYDGTNASGDLLFEHTNTSQFNLADLMVIAPSGDIYMRMTSDGVISCSSGSQTSWAWVVGCLDCTPPTATFSVVLDCENSQFFVRAVVTSLGSDNQMELTSSAGAPTVPVTGPGTYQSGPYPLGTTTIVTLVNDANNLCNISSPSLTNSICPLIIDCDDPQINETYCYGNNDAHEWYYQSSTGQAVALIFNAGTIESSSWDHLTITDGPGGSILFDHNQTSQFDLTGTLAVSGANGIFMSMTSDGSSSCSSGSQTAWAWTVGCLDCTNPEVAFEVVPDCIHHEFYVAANVPNTGSSSTVRIANTLNTDTLMGVQTGQTMVGPFPMGSNVRLTVMNAENDLCRVISPTMTSLIPDCVIPTCAATGYEYCYGNNDTAWFVFQGSAGVPITIHFDWGQLLVTDYIQVYNGLNTDAQLIYMGNMGGNLAGFAITSNNAANALCMRIISNWTGSCQDGQAAGLYFVAECGAVGMSELPESLFDMYPNPTDGQVYLRLPATMANGSTILVTDLTGRQVHAARPEGLVNGLAVLDLNALANGMYAVTVMNGDHRTTRQLQILR